MKAHYRPNQRPQFHCSNPSGRCDRCGQTITQHLTGNYYCPPPPREEIDWNTEPQVRRH